MTKKKLKIVIPGGLDIDFEKYLKSNFKKINTLSNYNILSVTKRPSLLTKELSDADVFITTRWPNKKIIAPKLKLIQIPAAGYDNIHFESVPKGCIVSNTFEHEIPMAEYCLLAMLESEIHLNKMDIQLKKGDWTGYFSRTSFHGELYNQNLGIIGFGHIGKEISKRANAFGMNITAIVRDIKKYKNNNKINFISSKNIKTIINKINYLIVACPLNESTKDMVDLKLIKKMNKRAVIINVARGPIVNEDDLYVALKHKLIRGAVIDVWYNYPQNNSSKKLYPSKNPLHKLKNVIFSPHASAWSHQLWDRRFKFICENLEKLYNNKKLKNIVNE
ncbi:2-hydroxyacid dehydrogenase [Alphaproteobacteria bacterium]|nr:2-hydroxyacid dehydrogenase [Alphaproteobacteria bacterium]